MYNVPNCHCSLSPSIVLEPIQHLLLSTHRILANSRAIQIMADIVLSIYRYSTDIPPTFSVVQNRIGIQYYVYKTIMVNFQLISHYFVHLWNVEYWARDTPSCTPSLPQCVMSSPPLG